MCDLQCSKWSSPQCILSSQSCGLPQWSPHSWFILFHGSRGSHLITSRSCIWHLSQNLDQNEDLFPGVHERWPVMDSKEDVGRLQIRVVGKFVQPHQLWELCLLLTSTSMRASIQVFCFSLCKPIIMSFHACNLMITRLWIRCCCLYQTSSEKHNKATSASYSSNLHTMIATMMTIMSSCQRHPYIPVKTTPCGSPLLTLLHLHCITQLRPVLIYINPAGTMWSTQ